MMAGITCCIITSPANCSFLRITWALGQKHMERSLPYFPGWEGQTRAVGHQGPGKVHVPLTHSGQQELCGDIFSDLLLPTGMALKARGKGLLNGMLRRWQT